MPEVMGSRASVALPAGRECVPEFERPDEITDVGGGGGAQLRAQAVVVLKRAGDEELGQYLLQAPPPPPPPLLLTINVEWTNLHASRSRQGIVKSRTDFAPVILYPSLSQHAQVAGKGGSAPAAVSRHCTR